MQVKEKKISEYRDNTKVCFGILDELISPNNKIS